MRTRIRTAIWEQLREVAEEESELVGEHVTVSDLVRVACYNYLIAWKALRRLEHVPPDLEDSEEEEPENVLLQLNPML